MSSICLSFALRIASRCANASAALGLILIANEADQRGFLTMTAPELATAIGCSDSTARSVIRSLSADGHITLKRLTHRTVGDVGFLFIVNFPDRDRLSAEEANLAWWATEAIRRRIDKPTRSDKSDFNPESGGDSGVAIITSPTDAEPSTTLVSKATALPATEPPFPVDINSLPGVPKSATPFSRSSFIEDLINPLEQRKKGETRAQGRPIVPADCELDEYPGDLQSETWREFVELQRELDRPLTPTNVKRFLRFMRKLAQDGESVEKSVSNSIDGRWAQLYAPSTAYKNSYKRLQNSSTESDPRSSSGHLGALAAMVDRAAS